MAINVKKLKRVIQGGEPLKVLNSGVKKPAFRQNGYGLTFDAANSDYLNAGAVDWVTWGDVSLDVYFGLDLDNIVDFTYPVSYFIDNSNRISVFWGSNQLMRLRVVVDGLTIIDTNYTLTPQKENLLSIKDGIVIFNGVTYDGSANVSQSFLNANTVPLSFGARLNTNWREFCNCSLYSFSINTEQFNFTESRGTTTTGSNGTTATINTSHASGIQYLDSKVWNKKSFALIGDPLDNEKVTILGVDYPLSSTPITEIEHLGEKFNLTEGLGNQVYGDSGNIGIISTDNVLGIDRINYDMWLKGDDTNGWNPYTV